MVGHWRGKVLIEARYALRRRAHPRRCSAPPSVRALLEGAGRTSARTFFGDYAEAVAAAVIQPPFSFRRRGRQIVESHAISDRAALVVRAALALRPLRA